MLSRSTAYDLRCPNVILCSHISGVSRPAELTSKVFLLYVHSWYSGVQKQTLKLCSMNKDLSNFEGILSISEGSNDFIVPAILKNNLIKVLFLDRVGLQ